MSQGRGESDANRPVSQSQETSIPHANVEGPRDS